MSGSPMLDLPLPYVRFVVVQARFDANLRKEQSSLDTANKATSLMGDLQNWPADTSPKPFGVTYLL